MILEIDPKLNLRKFSYLKSNGIFGLASNFNTGIEEVVISL